MTQQSRGPASERKKERKEKRGKKSLAEETASFALTSFQHSCSPDVPVDQNFFHTIKQLKLWKIPARGKQAGKQRPYCGFPSGSWRARNQACAQCVHTVLPRISGHRPSLHGESPTDFGAPLLCLYFEILEPDLWFTGGESLAADAATPRPHVTNNH